MKPLTHLLSLCLAMSMISCQSQEAQEPEVYRDIVFAQAPMSATDPISLTNPEYKDLKINIYKGIGADSQPVVLFVHGGAWVSGNNELDPAGSEQIEALMELRKCGITVAASTYRFSNEAIYPAQIHDVKGAIRFLKANAEAYGIDPDRVMTMGESAGAMLALMAALSNGEAFEEGATGGNEAFDSRVVGCVDCYGMTDFTTLAADLYARPDLSLSDQHIYELVEDKTSSRSLLFGLTTDEINLGTVVKNPDLSPAAFSCVVAGSPISHVSPDDPPILIINGQRDGRVPTAQALKLYQALYDQGVEAELILNDRAPHGNLGQESAAAIQAFIKRILLD